MKSKHLLMMLLLALMVPLAAKAQTNIYEMDFAGSPYGWDTYNTLGTGTVAVNSGKLVFTANTLGTLSGNSGCIFGDKMCDLTNETGERVVKVGLTLKPSEVTNANANNQFMFAVGYFANGSSTFTSKKTYSSRDTDFKDLHGNPQEASFTVVMEMPAGARIAFQMVSTAVNKFWMLDDVFVQDVIPTNLAASNLTHESAVVSWDAHGASNWELRYKKTNESEWTERLGLTNNSYTLEGLESRKNYVVEVRAKASQGQNYSSWSENLFFTTPYRKISADNGYGLTLYYDVIDEENHYVALTFPNSANPTTPWDGYTQPTGNIVLPSTVTNENVTYTVTQVGTRAFWNCLGVTGVTIPSTVTVIGDFSFYGNKITGQLVIPNSVITIGKQAFDDANSNPGSVELTIGEGVTSIGYAAFDMWALERVHFNAINCTTMGNGVFNENFKELTIGSQVTNIPDNAFSTDSFIQNSLTIPASVQNIGEGAFYNCIRIPSVYIESRQIPVSIGTRAFSGCTSLTSANLSGASAIGDRAFENCTLLSSLSIGENVSSIGDFAFAGCTSLECSIVIPNSVSTIGQSAFWDSSITEVTIGEGVTSVGTHAFWKCPKLTIVHFNAINCTSMKTDFSFSGDPDYYSVFNAGEDNPVSEEHAILKTVTIGPKVTNIPEYAFRFQDFTSPLVIPSSVQHIGKEAFQSNWGVPSLTIADGSQLVSIGDRAFYYCRVMTGDLNLPEGFTEIGMEAFDMCKLSSVNIPSTLHTISTAAFSGCKFSSVNIPSTVTSIGTYAFSGCGAEQGMVVNIEGDFEYGTYIRNYAFKDSKTKALTLGEGRFYIMEQAFKGCNMLEGDLVIPRATIGKSAFMDCTSLSSVQFSESVIMTEISEDAFNNCSGLTGNLIIPNIITTIGARAFNGCTNLNGALVLGQGVTSIGEEAFKQCSFSDIIVEPATRPTAASTTFDQVPNSTRVYVPYGQQNEYQSNAATGWNDITYNYFEQFEYIANNGNWVRTDNWANGAAPTYSNVVCINADNALMNADVQSVKFLYVRTGKTLNVTGKLIANLGVHTPSASSLVVKENSTQHGQLVNPANYTLGTVQKGITGYGTDSNPAGWYTVATPIQDGTRVNDFLTGEYDLYYYSEESDTWVNKKSHPEFTTLNPAQGYLYAKKDNGNASFAGLLNSSNADFTSVPVSFTTGEHAGFNLIGNPYTHNISINNVKQGSTALTQYYKVDGGSGLVAYTTEEPIRPGEGFVVKATSSTPLSFAEATRETPNDSYLRLVLSEEGRMCDRAYLRLNEGSVLEKFVFGDAQSLLYFMNDDERFAIAPNSDAKRVPLFFEPTANGRFTIDADLLNADCDYLHLIDNMTGSEIDLLQTPTYTFEANIHNYAARFELVFDKNTSNSDSDNFAYMNDGRLVLFGIEGNATLQVVDVLGHVLCSEQFSGSYDKPFQVAPGLYVLRLINGDNVKTQKIVVK